MANQSKGLLKQVRTQPWFLFLREVLESIDGLDWTITQKPGSKHPKLTVNYMGKRFTHPVPSSSACDHKQIGRRVKKFVQQCQEGKR